MSKKNGNKRTDAPAVPMVEGVPSIDVNGKRCIPVEVKTWQMMVGRVRGMNVENWRAVRAEFLRVAGDGGAAWRELQAVETAKPGGLAPALANADNAEQEARAALERFGRAVGGLELSRALAHPKGEAAGLRALTTERMEKIIRGRLSAVAEEVVGVTAAQVLEGVERTREEVGGLAAMVSRFWNRGKRLMGWKDTERIDYKGMGMWTWVDRYVEEGKSVSEACKMVLKNYEFDPDDHLASMMVQYSKRKKALTIPPK